MFTGIIEQMGTVKEVILNGSNKIFWIESSLSSGFKPDQSVNHSGACLTVEEISGNKHRVTAVDETLQKTNLGKWTEGTSINLEQCLLLTDRLDGHLVQGHVDTTGTCIKRKEKNGSWEFEFRFPKKFAELVIEKGSVCINGISLTAFDVTKKKIRVAIIPYTFGHTSMQHMKKGDQVNIEFDLIGKYIINQIRLQKNNSTL